LNFFPFFAFGGGFLPVIRQRIDEAETDVLKQFIIARTGPPPHRGFFSRLAVGLPLGHRHKPGTGFAAPSAAGATSL
jgi:hypothetical protein